MATSWGQKKVAAVKRFKQESIGTLSFKIQRRERQQERQKTVGFISKTTTLHVYHAFLCISLPVFARLRREHANSKW